MANLSSAPAWLPLPDRTSRIETITELALRSDRYGGVQVSEGPAFATYGVEYRSEPSADFPPENADLFVQPSLRPVLSEIVQELQLDPMSPGEKLRAVASYFQNNFNYSLYQPKRELESDPLENFLTKTRSGHCEYFATATVLLLRMAGIPARYSVGYSVQEWSAREQAYVVRNRHAHAWARVYAHGAWEDLDTTPASWVTAEAAQSPRWQAVQDWLSWSWYRLMQSKPDNIQGWIGEGAVWLIVPVIGLAIWWFRILSRKRALSNIGSGRGNVPIEGKDSDFYQVERFLEKAGFGRLPAESVQGWLQRLEQTAKGAFAVESLRPLVSLHYRYRFDPQGLRTQDRARLKFLVESWIAQNRHAMKRT